MVDSDEAPEAGAGVANATESTAEEEADDESSDDEGWAITSILDERLLYDGRNFQRQYWVERAEKSRTTQGAQRHTLADTHDNDDMHPTLLRAWRSKHPLKTLPLVYGGKGAVTPAAKRELPLYQEQWENKC